MGKTKRTGHYVASTHWDREWYESFQEYRYRLVKLFDHLLDEMARSTDFRYFQADGQAILIEDYLEIRPERTEQLRKFAQEGRIKFGPWYVLPDEFIVSGESLIRNLQRGLRIAGQWGQPSRAGFVCDIFGHTSQLPQILRGLKIDNAIIWRGTNESTHGALFNWRSPDGSEVMAYRFSIKGGYGTYAYMIRNARDPQVTWDTNALLTPMRELIDHEMERTPTDAFLLFDGGDHMEIEPQTAELLAKTNEQLEDVEIIHSHLDGFVEDLREQRDRISLTVTGELRDYGEVGEETWLIPGVLSSRIHHKQANNRCETELGLWAEPWSVFASQLGKEYPTTYLDLAWKYLLQNHPHDSICSCSIDQVHKDMDYRFDQCIQIARRQADEALKHIAGRVTVPEIGDKDFAVVVFNPSADAIDGPVDLTLRFPNDIDTIYQEFFGYEPKIAFRLFDDAGNEIPYQYASYRWNKIGKYRKWAKFPRPDHRHEIDVTLSLKVPAYGYTRFVVRPAPEREPSRGHSVPTRHLGSLVVDDHTIANEYLNVAADNHGALTITDKTSGQSYERVLTLEDSADIGDGWFHGIAVHDEVFTSRACAADVAVTADGLYKATLRIRVNLNVPEAFDFHTMRRSDKLAPLVVTHHVTLHKGSEAIEVRTEVENTVRDHRLRVLFPSDAKATTYLADAAFDVIERDIAMREDRGRFKELEVETRPQQTWTAVHDDTRGLAVVSAGLPESTIRDIPERPIALTLLRSFIKAVLTDGQEGGEIQGHHEFRYRIVPLAGRPDAGRLCRMGQTLAAGGVRTVQVEPRDLKDQAEMGHPARDLPASLSFFELTGPEMVVTALLRPEGGDICARGFNTGDQPVETTWKIYGAETKACVTDLEYRPGDALKLDAGTARLAVGPKQIVNVCVK